MKSYLLLIVLFLILSCNVKDKNSIKHFASLSMKEDVFISTKTDFKDTLFYEYRFPDSTKYYYVKLNQKQTEKLKTLIENICSEKNSQKFELSIGQQLFLVDGKQDRFYVNDLSKETENFKKLNYFLKESSQKMISTKEIKTFWDFGKFIPPPNPPKRIQNIKLNTRIKW